MADWDQLLAELDRELNPSASPHEARSQGTAPARKHSTEGLLPRQCQPVLLGGALIPMGWGSNLNPRSCDQLLCLSCDSKVVFYDNFQWNKEVDYLFLRNNFPDFHRLQAGLSSRPGCRAYACQCQHRSRRKVSPTQKRVVRHWAIKTRVGGPGEPFWSRSRSCPTRIFWFSLISGRPTEGKTWSRCRSHSYTKTGLLASFIWAKAVSLRVRLRG
eukprot:maker-scaffold1329_size47409-snap-gene-0.12 protein:Tk08802 transcript:maker-scaffold1329_size47409-snap-gene-0.12-mRNA-1 annotation:"protein c8orf37 homolog"